MQKKKVVLIRLLGLTLLAYGIFSFYSFILFRSNVIAVTLNLDLGGWVKSVFQGFLSTTLSY